MNLPIRTSLAGLLALVVIPTSQSGVPPAAAAEKFGGTERSMALARLSPEYRTIYWGLQYLLNPYQERQFLLLPTDEEREEWLRIFWAQNDPTPDTEVNERRIEHEARVAAALEFFPSSKSPPWDRRGEILIRFGPPPIRNKTWGETTTTRYIPPGEQWLYPKIGMLVEFEESHKGGEYRYAMTKYPYELFALQITENSPTHAEDERNVVLTEGNERLKTSSRPAPPRGELPKTIDYVQWRDDELVSFEKDLIATWEREKVEKLRENFQKVDAETPAIFSYDLKVKRLWFVFDVEDFFGGDTASRVEFYCQIPTREIGFEQFDGGWRSDCTFTVVVQDARYREISRATRAVQAVFSSEDAVGTSSFIPAQIQLPLEPGFYRLVLSVQDVLKGRKGSYRTNFQVHAYGRDLSLSGVEFASHIGQATTSGPFVKGPLTVVPHPVRAYGTSRPLSLYFEVYGLALDADGLSRYQVSYSIAAHNPRRGPKFWDRYEDSRKVISSSFDASGYSSRDTQHLTIDTSNLWKDWFDLQIEVVDRVTGRSSRVVKTFHILSGD